MFLGMPAELGFFSELFSLHPTCIEYRTSNIFFSLPASKYRVTTSGYISAKFNIDLSDLFSVTNVSVKKKKK